MLSLAKPGLVQQAEIAIQTQLGDWFASPELGSDLHKVGQLKNSRENYLKLRQSILNAVAHLPVEVETSWEGNEFHYKVTEAQL